MDSNSKVGHAGQGPEAAAAHKHIVKRVDDDLASLRARVLQMGELVSQQIRDAVEALVGEELDLARTVIKREESVDHMEVEADEQLVTFLATRQPLGPDLRNVLALGRSVRDLERMGDEAERIARVAIEIHGRSQGSKPASDLFRDIRPMALVAMNLVEGCLLALTRLDLPEAARVRAADRILDGDFAAGLRRLTTYVLEDPRNIGHVINVTFVLKALERIGDHATNIAEHVVFLVKGKDIRHRGDSWPPDELSK